MYAAAEMVLASPTSKASPPASMQSFPPRLGTATSDPSRYDPRRCSATMSYPRRSPFSCTTPPVPRSSSLLPLVLIHITTVGIGRWCRKEERRICLVTAEEMQYRDVLRINMQRYNVCWRHDLCATLSPPTSLRVSNFTSTMGFLW